MTALGDRVDGLYRVALALKDDRAEAEALARGACDRAIARARFPDEVVARLGVEEAELAERAGGAAADPEISAPLALQEHVRRLAEDARHRPAGRREPSRKVIALIGAVLAVAATVTALLAPDPPTIARVAVVAEGPVTAAAPEGSEDDLPGLRPLGARSDTIAGRGARTVVYRDGDLTVRYTVVDGKPLELPGTARTQIGDLEVALTTAGGVSLAAWHQDGRTRILASRNATPARLADLLRRG